MYRREVLAAITTGALAGCLSDSEQSETPEKPETPETSETSENSKDSLPYKIELKDHLVALEYSNANATEKLRYLNGDELAYAEPQSDLWVQAMISIENQSGDPMPADELTNVALVVSGLEYAPIPSFPFDWENERINRDDKGRWAEAGYTSGATAGNIPAGEDMRYYPAFDVPETTDPALIWRYKDEETKLAPKSFWRV